MAISGGDGSIILTTKIDESGLNDGLKKLRGGILGFEKALKGVAVAGAGAFGIFELVKNLGQLKHGCVPMI